VKYNIEIKSTIFCRFKCTKSSNKHKPIRVNGHYFVWGGGLYFCFGGLSPSPSPCLATSLTFGERRRVVDYYYYYYSIMLSPTHIILTKCLASCGPVIIVVRYCRMIYVQSLARHYVYWHGTHPAMYPRSTNYCSYYHHWHTYTNIPEALTQRYRGLLAYSWQSCNLSVVLKLIQPKCRPTSVIRQESTYTQPNHPMSLLFIHNLTTLCHSYLYTA